MKDQTRKKIVHKPVLVDEVVELLSLTDLALLNITDRKVIIDATVGAGGHSKEFIKLGYFVLGIDDDLKMLNRAENVLKRACPPHNNDIAGCFKLIHGNFRNIDTIAHGNGIDNVFGILYDLGISRFHYLDDDRGFSFQKEEQPLDMRLSNAQGVTASDLVNSLPEKELIKLFSSVLDYRDAVKLSNQIVNKRQEEKIKSVGDFNKIVKSRLRSTGKLNVATKPMMALRIAVNSELDNLAESLPKAFDLLAVGGRLAVISFHSGEDRIVKNYFKELAGKEKCRLITEKPVEPKKIEIDNNPLSRSAKLRVIEKI
jgi:16S rRNA (cytosine1402-N4)-methyltransferase